jgi:four helix bundle protein
MAVKQYRELETHLVLCQRVGLLCELAVEDLLTKTEHISRMLSGLRKALQNRL